MRRIVILGSGFAGLHTAHHLADELGNRRHLDVTVVTDRSHFLFTPLWSSVATGTSRLPQIAIELNSLLAPPVRAVMDRATTIDLDTREVVGEQGRYPFDFLVLAVGATTDWRGLPQLAAHAHRCKSGRDAVEVFEAVERAVEAALDTEDLERARRALTFVVAGAGPTGVELAARLACRLDQDVATALPPSLVSQTRLILVEPEDTVLPGMDADLRPIAGDHLRRANVDVRLGEAVVANSPGRVSLASGETIAADNLFWCGGVRAPRWLVDAGLEVDAEGRVVVHRNLQVVGHHGVYAAGDLAATEAPMTADVAVSQAKIVARNIVADLAGRSRREWSPTSEGQYVSLGRNNAAVSTRGLVMQGRAAQAVWGVTHSRLIPANLRKLVLIRDLLKGAFTARPQTTAGFLPE